MTLRFNILGLEVAKLELDFGDLFGSSSDHVTPVDRWAKGTSHWFFRRMTK